VAVDAMRLLHLARALRKSTNSYRSNLWFISGAAYDVTGTESLNSDQAAFPAVCRAIEQEDAEVSCRVLDLEVPKGVQVAENCAAWLFTELTTMYVREGTVALRGGYRWVQRFERPRAMRLPHEERGLVRVGGVYVFTGGLGRIALALAERLVTKYNCKIVLFGRGAALDSLTLEHCIKELEREDENDPRIPTLRSLVSSRADALLCRGDASNHSDLLRCLTMAEQRWGVVHGVIHAAGIVNSSAFASVADLSVEDFVKHFRPKVIGARVLRDVLEEKQMRPDFVLLLSSLSALLGGPGLGAYAAANACMDAFAHAQRRITGSNWLSLDMDGWKSEVRSASSNTENILLDPDEGVNAILRSLEIRGTAQVVIAAGEFNVRWRRWGWLECSPTVPGGSDHNFDQSQSPLESFGPEADLQPISDLEKRIAMMWAELLGLDSVGIHDDFISLGGHSLLALQIISRVRRDFGMSLTLDTLFTCRTVSKLSSLIYERLLREVLEMTDEEAQQLL